MNTRYVLEVEHADNTTTREHHDRRDALDQSFEKHKTDPTADAIWIWAITDTEIDYWMKGDN